MINLFKLHFNYLYSWKIIYISLVLVIISVLSFLLFSKFNLDYELLSFNASYYNEEYYFESINYFKIVIVLYNMFLVINGFALNKYDAFLLIRRTRKQIISTKVLTLLFGNMVIVMVVYLLFLIIGLFLTPYMQVNITDLSVLTDFLIFGSVYLLMFTIIYLYTKVIYSMLIIIVGFFITDLSMDYNILRENASVTAKSINLIFINIGYFSNIEYTLFYGKVYGIILGLIMFVVILTKYCRSDF